MKYMYTIIKNWRETRLGTRERRLEEMKQNEAILSELQSAMGGRDIEKQRIAIEKALIYPVIAKKRGIEGA
jgi:hypothetical protein